MRIIVAALVVVMVGLGAIGKTHAASDGAESPADAGVLSAADKTQLLRALALEPDAQGQVDNGCGENVRPQILPVALGGALGTAQLVIIGGGPNTLTCNGDGPGALTLVQRDSTGFRPIFAGRGYLSVLPTRHNGVSDISFGGPGFTFPVLQWDGQSYVDSGRTISDTEFTAGTVLPKN